MRLLILGVMKSVMLKIGKWLRGIGQNSAFINKVTGKLHIIKSLNIEWCKILDYPTTGKAGGCVSENFAAMARIGMWFYSNLYDLIIQRNTKIQKETQNTGVQINAKGGCKSGV
jgi:hypothetical protein